MMMASLRWACINQALLACALASEAAPAEPEGPALCGGDPSVSLLQHSAVGPFLQEAAHPLPQLVQEAATDGDLVMMHVPYNFGNTVAMMASELSSGAILWSWHSPGLQVTSEVGCPLYMTPQKYWPKAVAEGYFGGKKVFGILRDPYERLVAQFRGNFAQYGGFGASYRASCNVDAAVKELLTGILNNSIDIFRGACTFVPQAEYFQGEYGIQVPVNNRLFPSSMNEVFAAHNYSIYITQDRILHVEGCNDVWAGDLSPEARHLVQTVYKDDFDLLCKNFGYCDVDESVCLVEVPHMCPPKAFEWNSAQMRYVPKGDSS